MLATRILLTTALVLLSAATAFAVPIVSTSVGGPWSDPATWVGGVVPGEADDVVIDGAVEFTGTVACQSLTVNAGAYVGAEYTGPFYTLQVAQDVANEGTIGDGSFNFYLEVGGDLHNAGIWAAHQTTITGTYDRQLVQDPAGTFSTDLVFGPAATGDLIALTPLSVTGDVDVRGGRLVLQPACKFTLDEGAFRGEMLAGGNEMEFVSWSYLDFATVDDVVLIGEVETATAVTFTTCVTVQGILQNSTGGGSVSIEGDLINNGLIQNDHYGYRVFLTGNLVNNGSMTNSILEFTGDAVHHLSMGPDAVMDVNVFLPEFTARTLVADTPVRFSDGLGLGVGKLILEPGSSLEFTDFGGLGSGTVEANHNEIRVSGSGGLGAVTIDRGVMADQVAMLSDVTFTNGVKVTGTITSWPWAAADLTVEGLLRNEGKIQDGDHPVTVTALNDVLNLGIFQNTALVMAGVVDQSLGAGPGIVANVLLTSGLQAADYQWYRDGAPLEGQTAADLDLAGVGPAEYGTYHCVGDGLTSRTIVIAEGIATSDVPGAAPAVALEQNHPNPFNPATEIAFRLDRAGPVSLAVYDLAGRRVADLVNREMDAGRHQVTWQPRDLASGTYVFRLQTDGTILSRKALLLK